MRVAVVGCGAWGATVAKRVQSVAGIELVAVCDANGARAEGLGHALMLPWSISLDGIAEHEPTHVILATPPGSGRLEQVRRLIGLGVRHLRIEKPVAIDPGEARQILALCTAAGIEATVGHTPLNDEGVGMISEIIGGWESVVMHSLRIGSRRPAHDVGVVHDLLAHDTALALLLFGTLELREISDHGDAAGLVFEGPGVTATLRAVQSAERMAARHTIFLRPSTSEILEYDELEGTLTHDDRVVWQRERDPLGIELERWRDGAAFTLSFGVEVCELLGPAEQARGVA
jgi:predicted dehydrogenase